MSAETPQQVDVKTLVAEAKGKKCDRAWSAINPIPCTLDEWRHEWRRQYLDKRLTHNE